MPSCLGVSKGDGAFFCDSMIVVNYVKSSMEEKTRLSTSIT